MILNIYGVESYDPLKRSLRDAKYKQSYSVGWNPRLICFVATRQQNMTPAKTRRVATAEKPPWKLRCIATTKDDARKPRRVATVDHSRGFQPTEHAQKNTSSRSDRL